MTEDLMNNAPALELGLQELESLEAPGFWTGVSTGFKATAAVISVAAASAGIAT
ncbi:daptide-type RiPP [Yimella sp. NH-Cas1]|uniref:daptide-type RiPP n=1 Tax=Yimella sp. NH-Cas1 TaxID=2917726 RepID=UPI001EFAAE77|nr:daptide-type RiPP [Yimella sp. NH-Cas1]MCG8654522.1 hypothetical protein [Yimella sp. NH-Cas1]